MFYICLNVKIFEEALGDSEVCLAAMLHNNVAVGTAAE